MASPAAHSLIGLAIGMARFLPRVSTWRELASAAWKHRTSLFICILLANAPDLDYLFGIPQGNLNLYHHTVTHTIAWTALLSASIVLIGWPDRSWKSFMFVLALTASHLAADFFTEDLSKPYGMMLGWPFCVRYWISPVPVFPAPLKSSFPELLTTHNIGVVLKEMLIVLPIVALVALYKRTARKS